MANKKNNTLEDKEDFNFGAGITITGKFKLKCALVNKNTSKSLVNFFNVETFKYIKFEEHAGCDLPMFILEFTAISSDVTKYLNQGNILRVSLTKLQMLESGEQEEEDVLLQDYCIIKPTVTISGGVKNIKITGMLNYPDYVYDRGIEVYKQKTSKQVLKKIGEK